MDVEQPPALHDRRRDRVFKFCVRSSAVPDIPRGRRSQTQPIQDDEIVEGHEVRASTVRAMQQREDVLGYLSVT